MADVVDSITASALGPRLVFTKLSGRSTRDLGEQAYREFAAIVATMDKPVWISDATELTGFEASALTLGPRWFSTYWARGGRYCLVVSQWDRAMMAARTMALGIGVKIRNFPSLEEATVAANEFLVQG